MLSKDIAKEWNISGKSEALETADILRIGQTLYQAILVKSLDILSLTEEEELDALLDTDETEPQDVLKFLKSKIPTFDRLVTEERLKLKEGVVVAK